jgi:polyphosphate kinase 2 (PPK2 family)
MDLEQRFRVPEKGFRLADYDTGDTAGLDRVHAEQGMQEDLARLADLQERLYAEGRRSLLIVLQARDASGKDSTIAHVMRGLNPQGVAVTSFKPPTSTELAHDFLWRAQIPLPARGHIGVFNRSHYEEVLVVRVHPQYLAPQGVDPARAADDQFWEQRFEDIVTWERHLARCGTHIVKFFLNVSKQKQRKRLLARAEAKEKAYDKMLRGTSTAHAPWFVIPADHKWFLRTAVASIVAAHLTAMDPQFPVPSPQERAAMAEAVAALLAED